MNEKISNCCCETVNIYAMFFVMSLSRLSLPVSLTVNIYAMFFVVSLNRLTLPVSLMTITVCRCYDVLYNCENVGGRKLAVRLLGSSL
jgi:hypothetical protein